MALSHPAVRAQNKAEDNPHSDETLAYLAQRDRSELKFALANISGAFDADEGSVDDPEDQGKIQKDELVALVQYAAEAESDGEE